MRIGGLIVCGLAVVFLSLPLCGSASAQYRDQDRDTRAVPSDARPPVESGRSASGAREEQLRGSRSRVQVEQGTPRFYATPERRRRAQRGGREPQPNGPRSRVQVRPGTPRFQAAPGRRTQAPRSIYNRPPERDWHRGRREPQRRIYVPRRWIHAERPHYRALRDRRFSHVWWCDFNCRIAFLFGFTVWNTNTVISAGSAYSFPIWEALEYNRTGETSLWESNWGYVEFTPIRTFRQRFGRLVRDCRDFLRVVVRNDGLERRYRGTACRNPDGAWWIVF